MILITGKGTFADKIKQHIADCTVVGRPEYDFAIKQDCDRLLLDFPSPDIVINTFAVHSADCWDMLTTNYVSIAYLTTQYYKQMSKGHIINVSSGSSWWPSYPDISFEKLYYGISKSNLSEFGKLFNRAVRDDTKDICVTTFEPGRFVSRMSGHTGLDIELIVNQIQHIIDHRVQHLSLIK